MEPILLVLALIAATTCLILMCKSPKAPRDVPKKTESFTQVPVIKPLTNLKMMAVNEECLKKDFDDKPLFSSSSIPYFNKSPSFLTQFALSLIRASSNHDFSFVISPFSLGAALAIVHDGAKGETQRELTRLLGKTLTSSEVSFLYSSLTSALSQKNSAVMTTVANRFYLRQNFKINQEYLSHVEKTFNASAVNINFEDREGSAMLINSFVCEKTRGMIREIVTPSSFCDELAAVLINAVYFKGVWETPFEKENTRKKKFHGVSGNRDEDFMHLRAFYSEYSINKDLTTIKLPYTDSNYSLVVLMPSGDFGVWRGSLTAEKLHAAIKNFERGKANLSLPKFECHSTTDGRESLEKLNVGRLFGKDADLSGIAKDLYISGIQHKASIEMNEEGTVAAAATEIDCYVLCDPELDPTVDLIIDRPFLYSIVRGDQILFIGQFC